MPGWWAGIRPLLVKHRALFPPQIDLPFLGAWIEHESDGRNDRSTPLGEVGLFQIHPLEVEAILGRKDTREAIAKIRSDPEAAVLWGAALMRHYAEAIEPFEIPRGTRLYHALLKVMHSSRPRGRRWLHHARAVLGRAPRSYEEFLAAVDAVAAGRHVGASGVKIPTKLPSCAPGWLLARRHAFVIEPDELRFPAARRRLLVALANQIQLQSTAGVLFTPGLLGAVFSRRFPEPVFGMPVPRAFAVVTSGWGRPRARRGGMHEGIDLFAPEGTPVYSVADGTVERIGEGQLAGLFLEIRHQGGWLSRYMHLGRIDATVGQIVARGTPIGVVGLTGIQFSKSHLHLSLRLPADRLPAYVQAFGRPKTGFGTSRFDDVTVPAEPVIPATGYTDRTIADAKNNGIPLHRPPSSWAGPAIGIASTLLLAGAFVAYRKRA